MAAFRHLTDATRINRLGRSAVAALGILCGALVTPSFAQDGPGVSAHEVKIGAWFPLSGSNTVYGVQQRAGADAYFELLNSRGGVGDRKVTYIVEDSAYNPQRTVAAARKLVARDEVLAVVSANGTAQSSAAFPYLLDEGKVPFLMPFASQLDWFYPPRPNLFGVQVPFELQARLLGAMAARDGAKKIIVVHTAIPVFEQTGVRIDPGYKAGGGSGEVQRYPVKLGTQDFAPIALEIAAKKPDALIFFMLQQEMTVLTKELKRQNLNVQMYTYSPNVIQSLVDLGGDSVEGMKGVSLVLPPTSNTPAVQEYREALAKYVPSEKPDFGSLTTFGQAKLFTAALGRIKGPLNRTSLTQAIEGMGSVETGIFPEVSFSPSRHMGLSKLYPVRVVHSQWQQDGDAVDVPTE